MLFWYHLPIPFFQNLSTVLLLSNVHKLWLLLSLTLMQFFKRPLLFYQRSNMRKCKTSSYYWIISHYYYSKYIQRNVTTFVETLIPYFNVLKTKIIAKISKPRSIKNCYIWTFPYVLVQSLSLFPLYLVCLDSPLLTYFIIYSQALKSCVDQTK